MPINYQNGKIYKITSNKTEKIYIGSTAHEYLSQRMRTHKSDYGKWKNGKPCYVSSFELLQYDDCLIILIEAFPCNSKDELRAREQHWINENKDVCLNIKKADTGIRAKNEIEYNQQYQKQHRIENKGKIGEQKKKYRTENKEKIANIQRKYRIENKEREIQKAKIYYQENKERYTEKHNCICGGVFTLSHKSRHEISKKHQAYLPVSHKLKI